jgi:inward rectifier potassium channel
MAKKKKDEFNDLGLGSKSLSGGARSLNKDGSFNIKKINVPFFERFNFFHELISMSWSRFMGLVILGYLIVNIIFASIYTFIGVENLTGTEGLTDFEKFLEAFFFSTQTITTLGYGRVAPVGIVANSVAAVESMLGLMTFALATGMLYGRFSKPSAKIKYSNHAVIAPYKDINGFMFRVVNPQNNQLLEVEVTVTLSLKRQGSELRDFHLLELERAKVVFFPYMWTIVHPITATSPLHELNEAELLAKDAEFIVMMKAFDESFSQVVYSRSSYKAFEIKWGQKFVHQVKHDEDGIIMDVGKLDETETFPLNGYN